jgi:hypothetical protein
LPIPFRDEEEIERLGNAAFLRILPATDGDAYVGALFLVNARGEPVEFSYNRLDVVQRFLWRPEGLVRHAARRLTASLFEICPRVPVVVLCFADEAPAELFTQDIQLEIPTARLAGESAIVGQGAGEQRELIGDTDAVQVFWSGGVPSDGDAARTLVENLAARGLLLEPFERAVVGLDEVYAQGKERDGVVA